MNSLVKPQSVINKAELHSPPEGDIICIHFSDGSELKIPLLNLEVGLKLIEKLPELKGAKVFYLHDFKDRRELLLTYEPVDSPLIHHISIKYRHKRVSLVSLLKVFLVGIK